MISDNLKQDVDSHQVARHPKKKREKISRLCMKVLKSVRKVWSLYSFDPTVMEFVDSKVKELIDLLHILFL